MELYLRDLKLVSIHFNSILSFNCDFSAPLLLQPPGLASTFPHPPGRSAILLLATHAIIACMLRGVRACNQNTPTTQRTSVMPHPSGSPGPGSWSLASRPDCLKHSKDRTTNACEIDTNKLMTEWFSNDVKHGTCFWWSNIQTKKKTASSPLARRLRTDLPGALPWWQTLLKSKPL